MSRETDPTINDPTPEELRNYEELEFLQFIDVWLARVREVEASAKKLKNKVQRIPDLEHDAVVLDTVLTEANDITEELLRLKDRCTVKKVMRRAFDLTTTSSVEEYVVMDRSLAIRELKLRRRAVLRLRQVVLSIYESYMNNI